MQYTVHPQCRPNCVGWHEILNGVSLLLTCVGFERCVAVSGFREPLFEARYAHDVLTVRGEVRCEAVRTRTGVDRREECSSGVVNSGEAVVGGLKRHRNPRVLVYAGHRLDELVQGELEVVGNHHRRAAARAQGEPVACRGCPLERALRTLVSDDDVALEKESDSYSLDGAGLAISSDSARWWGKMKKSREKETQILERKREISLGLVQPDHALADSRFKSERRYALTLPSWTDIAKAEIKGGQGSIATVARTRQFM
ncbi:hypothetical protein B0H14DRAFT_2609951 [Mycena olivaceomarginata]|nr:hypothetical protein B0H14DRAFT_2609951 [Mycena olivaceomarginata]